MRHSPDMTTLTYSKHRAEHVTSGPMMCTMVHIMLAHARERVAMSPVLSKVGIKIGQYDDAGSDEKQDGTRIPDETGWQRKTRQQTCREI